LNDPPDPRRVSRRHLLAGGLAAGAVAVSAAVGGSLAPSAEPAAAETGTATVPVDPRLDGDAVAGARDVVAFHGPHQAGILTPPQAAAVFVALDAIAPDRATLADAFRTLTERARLATAGFVPEPLDRAQPQDDSGILGPVVPPDGLTVTVGLGASLFDDRYGLAALRPAVLTRMPVFRNDRIDPAQTHGDVLVQLCANSLDTCLRALRDILRRTRGAFAIRWKIDGFHPPSKETVGGTGRNLLGFKDGTANPIRDDPALADTLIWAGPGEPPWAVGGTYQVVRTIRMLVEFWDRVSLIEQEQMIGRRRDTGAPLDAQHEFDTPEYPTDARGQIIPLNAHIRLANPRTAATDPSRILRRGYNYSRGFDTAGNLDTGLIFSAFNANIHRQFEANQARLDGEPLEDYVKPFGGGYFFTLPGVRDARDTYGSTLFT
jgi:deferrochelatase/peroxidase EfeB